MFSPVLNMHQRPMNIDFGNFIIGKELDLVIIYNKEGIFFSKTRFQRPYHAWLACSKNKYNQNGQKSDVKRKLLQKYPTFTGWKKKECFRIHIWWGGLLNWKTQLGKNCLAENPCDIIFLCFMFSSEKKKKKIYVWHIQSLFGIPFTFTIPAEKRKNGKKLSEKNQTED